jgi:hypothetical protein
MRRQFRILQRQLNDLRAHLGHPTLELDPADDKAA